MTNRFFEGIKKRKRVVELEDGTQINIISEQLKRYQDTVQLPESLQDSKHAGILSQNIRFASEI